MTPIHILDPIIRQFAGHHYEIDSRLARELVGLGHKVTIHGSTLADPELGAALAAAGVGFAPTFRVSMNDMSWDSPEYVRFARETNADLEAVPDDGLWLWPTFVPYQFLASVLHPRHPRQLGWLHRHPRSKNPLRPRTWVLAAKLAASAGLPMTLGTFEETLREAVAACSFGVEVELLPIPHSGTPNPRARDGLRRIGFLGQQRSERGIELIEPLVIRLLSMGYEVLLQDANETIRPQTDDPRLTVLGYVPDFPAAIASCDLLVWPSRSDKYRMRISGVVCEAIASGVPVVVPSGCGPATLAERYGCGTFFHEFTVESVLEAIV